MTVVDVEINRSQPYAEGRAFGERGAYTRIDGVLTYAVDPDHGASRLIVDLDLAPRDEQGRVRFRSDFTLLRPQDPSRGNQRLIVDVVNRGRRRAVSTFNRATVVESSREIPEGDGFLFKHGYSVVSIGWQWDVYRSKALLGLEAPPVETNGQPVRGKAVVEIRPNVLQCTWLLANRVHQPYPVAEFDDPSARLFVRDWEDGPDTEVPGDQWRFAQETDDGVVANAEHVYMESGFLPGKIYNVVYTAERARVVGTGLLAVRDVAVWLRHPSVLNPIEEGFERIYAYGVSQTGRLLRHFVYLGLNLDEEKRPVYDGLLPHVAGGRRGEFNHRFAQPSCQSAPGFGHLFPFADNETVDPHTERRDGLLRRSRALGAVPKIIYTNSSAEYWRGDGSLVHIDPSGRSDLEPSPEARVYHFAGTQHGAGSLAQSCGAGSDGSRGRYPLNVVDYRPLLRAALINLDTWVTHGTVPPPSRHPRLSDGTAATQGEVLASMKAVLPGLVTPDPDRLWVLRQVDLGPEADRGVGRYPVMEGPPYPCLVPAVDDDGNETGGIRLPDLEVPVATHAGWNLRDPESGAREQIIPMQGFSNFFAPTRSSRDEAKDPRQSVEERYRSRSEYLARVRDAAQRLADERYLLEDDLDVVVAACAEHYDFAKATETAESTAANG